MADKPTIPGGYVLLPRKLFDSDLMKRPPWERWLWLWMIAKAERRPKADGRKLDRGQLFTTIEEMREAVSYQVGARPVKPGRADLAKALRRLREGNRITTAKTTRGIIISICNYGLYQDAAMYEGNTPPPTKAKRRTHESAHDRQEEDKKNKKEGPASPPALFAGADAPRGKGNDRKRDSSAGTNGAAGRLVALWVEGCTARGLVFGDRGRVSGVLAGMLKSGHAEDRLAQAVGRWWGADRGDYGITLFKARLDGGNRELTGRAARPDPSALRRSEAAAAVLAEAQGIEVQ